ncbi:trk system potassium uptake protein TrkA [Lachnotalea glycerini]|uniref:Trk system potassium uptake protein TrkA n=1 Tax=Lachnotalea glycerini TaxID=1763509 RepID=A0A255IJK1_9FIRM|nr:TrkA family potassium uptake protein [Lachnotalea glycerini]PXV95633.1 trk system potassium uptake protein TrkA [Lachnotalea glycerini]RDY32922.1 TrkA family potassium uptake protein [Lachnotalea glycerini]
MKINDIKDDYQILIIGCGRLGASIANALSNRNRNVTIVDINKDSFRKLSPSFSGLSMEGDATDIKVLKEAEIIKADVLIAVTDNDNVNILIAQMAKSIFDIKEVIARLYDPEKECVYKECCIQTVFPALLSANEIDRILDKEEKNEK